MGATSGTILKDPCTAVARVSEREKEARIPFTVAQVRALVQATDHVEEMRLRDIGTASEWRGMILIGYYCGLRIGDATYIKWRDINLENSELRFKEEKTSHRKPKDQEETRVHLHRDLVAYLESAAGIDDPDAPLFGCLSLIPKQNRTLVSQKFSVILEYAGIKPVWGAAKTGRGRQLNKLSFHSFRHTMVSNLEANGVSDKIQKLIVGHSLTSDKVHNAYCHLPVEAQKKGIEAIESVV